jgi:glyoxylase-like metal-dependent hydrolase (beta-lactamase superfamily II)
MDMNGKFSTMPPKSLPLISRLTLAVVNAVPESHPERDSFEPFPVHAWVVHHTDGPILFDTGIGLGNSWIDEHYRPRVVPLAEALRKIGLKPDDIVAVIVSHLHFDHCGQLSELSAPVYVQRTEYEASREEGYTVPEWAELPEDRLRLLDGDQEIIPGIQLLLTPGHTPGHQSVLVETTNGRVLLAAQCVFRANEMLDQEPSASNLHDETWADVARASLERLRQLAPVSVQFSHDTEVVALKG